MTVGCVSRRAGITAIAIALMSIIACKKEAKDKPRPYTVAPDPVPDDRNDEPLRLCREVYPCRKDVPNPFDHGFCAKTADPEPVAYTTPGLRLMTQRCNIRNGDSLDVVGITESGQHLRRHALYPHVRGTPEQRARAALDLELGIFASSIVSSDQHGKPCPTEDKDGWLHMCTSGTVPKRCRVRADGAASCGPDGGEEAFRLCRESTRREILDAEEYEDRDISQTAPMFRQPADYALSRATHDGPISTDIPLRAPGLTLHFAFCSSPDHDMTRVHWGVDASGHLVTGRAFVSRLDHIEARAVMAAEANGHEDSGRLILDATPDRSGAPANLSGVARKSCDLPPGPREENGHLTFYVKSVRYRPGSAFPLYRCDFTTTDYRGGCAPVAPRERYCIWDDG